MKLFRITSLIALLLVICLRTEAGTCTGSCGGDSFRMPLNDIALDTFQSLEKLAEKRRLEVPLPEGGTKLVTLEEVRSWRTALASSIQERELKLVHSESDYQCPLRDNGGTCVTFLTKTETQELHIDIGRLSRHKTDIEFLRRAFIHEAMRLKKADDAGDQISRHLAGLVNQAAPVDPKLRTNLHLLALSYRENLPEEAREPDCVDCSSSRTRASQDSLTPIAEIARALQKGPSAEGYFCVLAEPDRGQIYGNFSQTESAARTLAMDDCLENRRVGSFLCSMADMRCEKIIAGKKFRCSLRERPSFKYLTPLNSKTEFVAIGRSLFEAEYKATLRCLQSRGPLFGCVNGPEESNDRFRCEEIGQK